MRIAIIGCNSLLASYLIECLLAEQGIKLTLLGRRPPQGLLLGADAVFQYFDFPNAPVQASDMLGHDAIIYCAAAGVQAGTDTSLNLIHALNFELPASLLAGLSQQHYDGKWLSFGSYFELGATPTGVPAMEVDVLESPFVVPNAYCEAKRQLSALLASQPPAFRAWHLILPTVYGVREHPDRLIPYLMRSLGRGEVPRLSAGAQTRQYVHGRDVADLVSLFLTRSIPSGIYNVAGPDVLPIKSLVAMVFARFGQRPDEALGAVQTRDESMPYLQLDGSKLAAALPDWQPQLPLALGLLEYPLHDTFPE